MGTRKVRYRKLPELAACAGANIGIEKMVSYLVPLVFLVVICLGFITF